MPGLSVRVLLPLTLAPASARDISARAAEFSSRFDGPALVDIRLERAAAWAPIVFRNHARIHRMTGDAGSFWERCAPQIIARREPRPVAIRWRIVRIKGTPAALLGPVEAPDEESAIRKAIEEFEIGPALQNRLLALRQ